MSSNTKNAVQVPQIAVDTFRRILRALLAYSDPSTQITPSSAVLTCDIPKDILDKLVLLLSTKVDLRYWFVRETGYVVRTYIS